MHPTMKPSIDLLLTVALAGIFTGCASTDAIRNARSLSVDARSPRPPVINFSDRLSEGMYGIGGVAGLVIGNAVSSGPKSRLEAAFQASGLNIDKIAGDAFAGEIQRSGTFALANDGGDATLKVEVTAYGLEHPFTDSFTSGVAPVIGLEAEVVKNGQRVYRLKGRRCFQTRAASEAGKAWPKLDDYLANPELLRAGLASAATTAAQSVLGELNKIAGRNGTALPAAR